MWTPLAQSFFEPSAEIIAPALLGHWLIRNTPDGPCGGPIVETEAYLTSDPASHASAGETSRNRVMWGSPGRAYVYLIYGYHFCVNAVCRPTGTAEAVLIRAIEPALGEELMRRSRSVKHIHELSNGPAKVCQAMAIDRDLDGVSLCDADSPLFIGSNPEVNRFRETRWPIVRATRIGITKAADSPLRFYLEGSPFVSRRGTGNRLKGRSE